MRPCDHDMHADVLCSVGAEPLDGPEVRSAAGPGHRAAAPVEVAP